jgi:hypothetical protein
MAPRSPRVSRVKSARCAHARHRVGLLPAHPREQRVPRNGVQVRERPGANVATASPLVQSASHARRLPKLRKPPPKAAALAGVCGRFSPGGSDSAHTPSGLRSAHRQPRSSNTRDSRAPGDDTLAVGHRSLAGAAGTSPSSTRSPDPQGTRQASPPVTRGCDRLLPRTPTTKTHGTTSVRGGSPPSAGASHS